MSEQITCDYCGTPVFVTTTSLVDAKGSKVCPVDGYHDHDGVMGTNRIGATYAEANRGQSNRLIELKGAPHD